MSSSQSTSPYTPRGKKAVLEFQAMVKSEALSNLEEEFSRAKELGLCHESFNMTSFVHLDLLQIEKLATLLNCLLGVVEENKSS